MSAMTDYLEKRLVDHVLGKTSYAKPAVAYLALLTANPTDAGSLTSEVSGSGYARQAITTAMSAADPTNGTSTNATTITFPVATGYWGPIAYFAIMDAATGGNVLLFVAVTPVREIASGDQYQVSPGALSVQFA